MPIILELNLSYFDQYFGNENSDSLPELNESDEDKTSEGEISEDEISEEITKLTGISNL